ncbi:MAG TPA: HAD family hydrolase, partial [Thermoanaerobaculia bacterium]|nr:HAD family hydrolase [Thermoanaerobaculia bacterium]
MLRRRLVLFDIDGTLITDGGAARQAFAEALAAVYGYGGDAGQYDFSGRTDPQIAFMVLRDHGLADEEIERGVPELWRRYVEALERNATPERVRALPGIEPLLSALAALEHLTIGLLTGNIEPGARLKLAPPALNDYFPFGAFGSDSADRDKLPPIAVERASRIDGRRFEREDIVIIGDSVYDVRCGVPYGATTIALATGKTPAAAL